MNQRSSILRVIIAMVAIWLGASGAYAQNPSIASFNPWHGAVGTTISISGNNLGTTNAVYFNNVASTQVTVTSNWGVKAVVPTGATTGKIRIVNQFGSYTTSTDFKVDQPPVGNPPNISGWTPWSAAVGTQISISGSGFNTLSSLKFNGTPALVVTVTNDSYLTAVVPVGATTGKLTLTNAIGSYTTGSDFQVLGNPPNINGWTPWGGDVGTSISISGAGFNTLQSLKFNDTVATSVTVTNDSYLTAVVPAGATTGKLTLINSVGSYTTGSDFVVTGGGGSGGGTSGGGTSGGGTSGGGSGGGTSGGGTSGGGTSGGGGYTLVVPPNINIPAGAMVGHPRLLIRQSDVATLRTWANANNTIWTSIEQLAEAAKTRMDLNQITDSGYGGGVVAPYESYSALFAFMSIVHPNAILRDDYANRAYTLIMIVFNEAAKGQADGQPFRGSNFAIGDRANWYGEQFPLVVDWIYQKFTASDKAKIRNVFLRWIQEDCHATTSGQDHPSPYNVYNDPSLVATLSQIRWATNNYYTNHMRGVALMAMALDDADDVPAAAGDPAAGTLRMFIGNAIQSWMYQVSKFEQTSGAGGVSPEGPGYGELDLRGIALTMLAMHTAGIDQPAVYGPQADLINSPYWDHEVMLAQLHLHSPSQTVVENWVGPEFLPYQFSDGDKYRTVDMVRVLGSLAIYAMHNGDTAKYAKLRWMIDNLPPGGVNYRSYKITTAFTGSSISMPILYFLSCDPNFNGQVDPRPTLPTEYFAPGLGILSSRTDWSTSASWFVAKSSWNMIDHQFADGNSFAFWRGGEWLTKPHAGYGEDIGCSDYQNTMAIQNVGNPQLSFWIANAARGSQWVYNSSGGDPKSHAVSYSNEYAFYESDATNLYNLPAASATDVNHASRSMLFLKPDLVFLYDRVESNSPGKFKRFWMNTPTLPTVNGNTATMTTQSGQKLFINTLLPANSTLEVSAEENLPGQMAAYEPMKFRFKAEDLSNPKSARFLHVLQGANAGAAKLATAVIQSQSGTPYDGAVAGSWVVMFKRNFADAFGGVTLIVPAGTAQTYVTGLVPGAAYTVTKTSVAGGTQIAISVGGNSQADSGGVLKVQ